jgi:hypothetical protein
MARFNTCRFCSAMMSDDLVKYGTRHYAHHRCYLDAGKKLADLPAHQIEQFPFFLLKERGLLEEARQLVEAKRNWRLNKIREGAR